MDIFNQICCLLPSCRLALMQVHHDVTSFNSFNLPFCYKQPGDKAKMGGKSWHAIKEFFNPICQIQAPSNKTRF